LRRCQQSEADDETTRRSAAGVARPDAGVRGGWRSHGICGAPAFRVRPHCVRTAIAWWGL